MVQNLGKLYKTKVDQEHQSADLIQPTKLKESVDLSTGEPKDSPLSTKLVARPSLRFWRRAQSRQHCQARVGFLLLVAFIVAGLAHPLVLAYWSKKSVPKDKGALQVTEQGNPLKGQSSSGQSLAQIYDPIRGNDLRMYDGILLNHPSPPSRIHPLGTDPLGRDVLSQLLYCIRVEFSFGVGSALLAVGIGALIGGIAAYFGGVVDTLLMRMADLVMILPKLAFLVFIAAFLSLDLFYLALIYGILAGLGGRAIVFRAQAKGVKVQSYVEASRALGGTDWHIIFRHILPELLPLAFFYLMRGVSEAILVEGTLSFLGLFKAQVSWGLMMETARQFGYSFGQAWWLYFPTGIVITLFCSSFYLIGRGLDSVLYPQLQGGNYERRGEK